jgi:hypothetical protein
MTDTMWRVEGKRFTCGVKVNAEGLIIDTAPILGQWRREQLTDLREFAARQGWQMEQLRAADDS